jgi:tetratricopeptide (TPR) repeat protein
LDWSLASGRADLAMRLAAALGRFWERGPVGEGRHWLETALSSASAGADPSAAEASRTAGRLASLQGDYRDASGLLEDARERFASQSDRAGLTATVAELAWITLVQGDYERSEELWNEALSYSRHQGDRHSIARALTGLGRVVAENGHHGRARKLTHEALELRRELGDAHNIANSLTALGRIELLAGRIGESRRLLDESLSLARGLGDRLREAEALYFLALAALYEGKTKESLASLGKRLELCRQLGDRLGIAECLDALGGIAALRDQGRRAARLFGAADGVRRSIGAAPWKLERARRERDEAAACSYLDRITFEEDKDLASTMSLDDAVALGEDSLAILERPVRSTAATTSS